MNEILDIEPCPNCDSKNINIYECGYSTFNPGGGICKDCKHSITGFVNFNVPFIDLLKIWNDGAKLQRKPKDDAKAVVILREQLKKLGIEPEA